MFYTPQLRYHLLMHVIITDKQMRGRDVQFSSNISNGAINHVNKMVGFFIN